MGIFAWLGRIALEFLLGKLVQALKQAIDQALKKKEIEAKAAKSVKPLEEAQTADEIDKASDDALSGF